MEATDVSDTAETAVDGLSGGAACGEAATCVDGAALVEDELLVEEISIDGMCGVY